MRSCSLAALVGLVAYARAQVTGSAFGFASGTTGGGSATPQYPSSLDELEEWLTDSTPRVIMIDQTFDFLSSEGTTTESCCSDDVTTKCPSGTSSGQAWITVDTCDSGTWTTCTYYNSPRNPIDISSNKSLVGVGSSGVIRGKGLRIRGGASNIIIQNIHITELNPQFVWGGDAITLDGADYVWIDHCKISLIGRQMLVSGWGIGGHVTVSNTEFDGVTSWSAGCNGKHYWTILLLGLQDYYTFSNNWVHDVSGRAPHMGTDYTASTILFHGVNNYFQDIDGHAFDIDVNVYALIEGNYFSNVKTPITSDSLTKDNDIYNVITVADAGNCDDELDYICEWNRLSGSGSFPSITDSGALDKFSQYTDYLIGHIGVADVPSSVSSNAGIGKLSTSSSNGGSTTTTTAGGTTTTTSSSGSCASLYGQCGGASWTGATCCSSGTCTYANDWYSQCVP